jgi:uncharacterized protein YfbU (UPF0304 family)
MRSYCNDASDSNGDFSFRIEDELKERLDRIADDRGLNVSQLFRQALLEKLDAIEPHWDRDNQFPLTIKERLSLVLQLRTLAAVEDEDNKKHLNAHIEALTSGYEFHYSELTNEFSNGFSRRACLEVLDILEMYSELLWGYEELPEKEELKREDIAFPGFDGNYETRQMSYAQYFLFDLTEAKVKGLWIVFINRTARHPRQSPERCHGLSSFCNYGFHL